MVGIYKITNLYTGESYVGKSKHIEKRWEEHFCKGYGARHSKKFQDAIDEYGKEGFYFQVLEECAPEELHEKERLWISVISPAYNTVMDGHRVSEETRAKISKSLTGKKQSQETRKKRIASILERHKTIPQTNEGHKKRVAIEVSDVMIFDSIKSAAEFLGVDASTVTKSLKRGWKVKGYKVWYVV